MSNGKNFEPGPFLRRHFHRRIINAKNKTKLLKSDYLPHPSPSESKTCSHSSESIVLRQNIEKHILSNDPRSLHQALRKARAAGISIRNCCDRSGHPFMCLAARYCQGLCPILKLLISFGCSVNAVDTYDGYTPCHYCVTLQYPHCVKYLVDIGADPNKTDARGRTCLMIAAFKKYEHIQYLLQQAGALVDKEDRNGNNAKAWGSHGLPEETHDPYLDNDGHLENILGISFGRNAPRSHMRYTT
jgi:ankyrin repeat protein